MSLENASYFELLKQLYEFLSWRRRRQILTVIFLMIASSLAEIFTLASVVPFLASLADPQELLKNNHIDFIASSLGISTGIGISYFFTAIFLILAISATLVRIGNLKMTSYISSSVGSDISTEIFKRTMYQPLIVHAQNNSSQLTSAISIHVNQLVNNVFRSILEGFNSALVILSVSFTLLFVDTRIAIASGVLVSGFYFIVITATRKKLIKISRKTPVLQEKLLQTLNEGLDVTGKIA
jgi:ABC-type multidrug transport system fused ATPase/permease subunit